jgi:NAD(P) transhydrogenase subunit beta
VQQQLINIAYLISAVLFIFGLKGLTSPRTARNGNLIGALGMLVAILATLFDRHILTFELILAGIALGSAIGVVLALKVPITAMPQLVAALNGFGGGASVLVAATAVLAPEMAGEVPPLQLYSASVASAVIGGATFTGSMIAWAKLQEVLHWQPRGGAVQALNFASIGLSVVLGAYYVYDPGILWPFWALTLTSCIYGVLLTAPVGGADMPVMIALLNSLSGLAATATGFVLSNSVLIISGTLVGASGVILTNIMCRAMNRSLAALAARWPRDRKPTKSTRGALRARLPKRRLSFSTGRATSRSCPAMAWRSRRRSMPCAT